MYNAYITRIKNVHKHPNADRLQIGECFGNAVVVSMEYEDNQLGVYFPSDGQLSVEFAEANNLLRKKDENGNNIGGYMDPDKRNVTAIRLRGEKSDGLFLPLKSLETFGDISILREGDRIDNFNGHEICCKYIPKKKERTSAGGAGTRAHRRAKRSVAPLFFEHADTEQLAYNLGVFKPGDEIEITLKMHGTSQRTGYVPVLKGYADSYACKMGNALRRIAYRFMNKENEFEYSHDGEPVYEYDYICGTRRVVLDRLDQTEDGGFYGTNGFRKQHHDKFVGKLNKGETVYYEVVGFTDTGTPIMGNGNNEKVGKDFVKQYGKETVFSYGCEPTGKKTMYGMDEEGAFSIETEVPQSDIYVYRMTMTNEDGFVVEYTPDFMRYRCEQMGVKTVEVFWRGTVDEFSNREVNGEMVYSQTAGETAKNIAERFYAGPDPVGKTHTREGVVVRIINRPKFSAYKHKNFEFKVLEGIIKNDASAPDMEEAQDTINEEEVNN